MGAVKKSRDPLERYDTPAHAVDALMEWLKHHVSLVAVDSICEPCCGAGAIVDAVNAYYDRAGIPVPHWHLSDIAPRAGFERVAGHYVFQDDYTHERLYQFAGRETELVITNPPFSKLLEIAKRAIEQAPVVALLGRVGWAEGASKKCPERAAFIRSSKPAMLILPKRPSFVYGGPLEFGTHGDKSTDNATYCWYVWGAAPGTWELLGGEQ